MNTFTNYELLFWLFLLAIFIITTMKHTHLSNFQKEQYTNYLEAQLQKFSAFMLSQKKENDNFKMVQQALRNQNEAMSQMQSKLELMEIYQHQNGQNCQKLFKKHQNLESMESRIRRLQDRERFDCDAQLKRKGSKSMREQKNNTQKEIESGLISKLDGVFSDINKRIRKIEDDIAKNKELQSSTFKMKINDHLDKVDHLDIEDIVLKKDIKKLEKKMKKYFAIKFEEIQEILEKPKKKKNKSPSAARSPYQLITKHHQESIKNNVLSEFKLDDQYQTKGKSDFSTISHQSKKTIDESRGQEKQKKRRSKSKSNNHKKDRSRSKSKSVSKSKSRTNQKSISFSQHSFLQSQVSRSKSKSNISKNKKSNNQKQIKSKRHDKSHSVTKSNHSSISHQKCKKRPQFMPLEPNHKPKNKQNSSFITKKKDKRNH